ncbi:MAG: hypothetical protein HYT09_01435 [Candidatus Levybacteria bacterium]|nr:hypothetical protein [Candidatus Levybacteria bacterium]
MDPNNQNLNNQVSPVPNQPVIPTTSQSPVPAAPQEEGRGGKKYAILLGILLAVLLVVAGIGLFYAYYQSQNKVADEVVVQEEQAIVEEEPITQDVAAVSDTNDIDTALEQLEEQNELIEKELAAFDEQANF